MSERQANPSHISRVLMCAIRLYQLTLSSLVGRTCRHLPTCSDYASDALIRFGALRGSMLAISRIWRCNPWGTDGYDPVPQTLPDHSWRIWRYGKWRGRDT